MSIIGSSSIIIIASTWAVLSRCLNHTITVCSGYRCWRAWAAGVFWLGLRVSHRGVTSSTQGPPCSVPPIICSRQTDSRKRKHRQRPPDTVHGSHRRRHHNDPADPGVDPADGVAGVRWGGQVGFSVASPDYRRCLDSDGTEASTVRWCVLSCLRCLMEAFINQFILKFKHFFHVWSKKYVYGLCWLTSAAW